MVDVISVAIWEIPRWGIVERSFGMVIGNMHVRWKGSHVVNLPPSGCRFSRGTFPHCGCTTGLCYRPLGHPTVTVARQFRVEIHAVGSLHSLHLCCCGPFVDVHIAIGWLMTEAGDIFWLSHLSCCWFDVSAMATSLSWALIYNGKILTLLVYSNMCILIPLSPLYQIFLSLISQYVSF